MNSAHYGYQKQNAASAYLVKEIMEATPQKLLLKVYDYSIQQCQLHDVAKANKGIGVLIDSLNFSDEDAKPIAMQLLALYQFSQDQMRKKNFDIVYKILTDLRDAWVQAFASLQEQKRG